MIAITGVTSVITLDYAATHDMPFQVTEQDLPFYDVNIHILTNAALYGNMKMQVAPIAVNGVLSFRNGNLKDFWFKNAVGAANTQIVVVATIPLPWVQQQLGMIQ